MLPLSEQTLEREGFSLNLTWVLVSWWPAYFECFCQPAGSPTDCKTGQKSPVRSPEAQRMSPTDNNIKLKSKSWMQKSNGASAVYWILLVQWTNSCFHRHLRKHVFAETIWKIRFKYLGSLVSTSVNRFPNLGSLLRDKRLYRTCRLACLWRSTYST